MPILSVGTPNNGWVNATSYKYYKIIAYIDDEILRISKSTSSDDIDLYLSLDQSNHYPNE